MAAFNFVNLIINIQRSVVDQNVGKCKTEASQKPVPIDEYTAKDLLAWYRLTPCRGPDDWVFATEAIVPERNVASYTARLVKAGH